MCVGFAVLAVLSCRCSEPGLPVGIVPVDGPPDCNGRCRWPAEACVAAQCRPTERDNPLAVAHAANCFRNAANGIACWGANEFGQIGQGAAGPSLFSPVMIPASNWISISAGAGPHFLALDSAERIWGWGANGDGQLGTGDLVNKYEPTLAKDSSTWAVLHAGSGHSCAQNQWGQLYCWGRNVDGELGTGDRTQRLVPVAVANARVWSLASVGWGHTCALDQEGTLWCWGRNIEGQLGTGDNVQRTLPERVSTDVKFNMISARGLHTCAIEIATQQLWCWGDNRDGKLGTGDQGPRNLPTLIAPEQRWVRVTTSAYRTCAVTIDAQAWCWGKNSEADSDAEDPTDLTLPMQAVADTGWRQLGVGHSHACGMAEGISTPLCWGRGNEGQLGQGAVVEALVPVPVMLP